MAKPSPRLERVAMYDLDRRPLTRAVLLRAANYADRAERELSALAAEAGLALKEVAQPRDLREEATGAVTIIATTLATRVKSNPVTALASNGRLLPEGKALLAFAISIAVVIESTLTSEGTASDTARACTQAAALCFILEPDTRRLALATQGMELFRALAAEGLPAYRDWCNRLGGIIEGYMHGWANQSGAMLEDDEDDLDAALREHFKRLLPFAQ